MILKQRIKGPYISIQSETVQQIFDVMPRILDTFLTLQSPSRWSDILSKGDGNNYIFKELKITNLSTATFFRLVSAYQDKLIDKKSWRVGSFKRILDAMKDHFGGVNFNAFAQVILYASETSCRKMNRCTLNVHWKPYIRKEQYCFEVILYLDYRLNLQFVD